ncbi:MAG: VOC family protein [Rhodobacterales bacterium]|nr:VOC family protein [Rhodobacterales bacterium]
MELDHLAVTCPSLEEGVAWTEASLGVTLLPGGQHTRYGTHNRLLGLGPGLYLEVIAPDPSKPSPAHPRWFGLDQSTAPSLGNWIVRTDNLYNAIQTAPEPVGEPVALSRGDLAWIIAVPPDGSLPMQGGFPTLIQWSAGTHPSMRLPESGLRLTRLEIHHPKAAILANVLSAGLTDPHVKFIQSGIPTLRAAFATPAGERWLG